MHELEEVLRGAIEKARRDALEEAIDRIGSTIAAYRRNEASIEYLDGLAEAQCSIRALAAQKKEG